MRLLSSELKTLISQYETVYFTCDIRRLPWVREYPLDVVIGSVLDFINEVSKSQSVFLPSATLSLCNNPDIFDIKLTPSENMGVIAERYRLEFAEVRSAHPFWSHCGSGDVARKILSEVHMNAYGAGSVWEKLLECRTLHISIGANLFQTPSIVHHVEQSVGVPYRYTKLFEKKVRYSEDCVTKGIYSLYVLDKAVDLVRDGNIKLCNNFEADYHNPGSGITAYDLGKFYSHLTKKFMENPFIWLRNEQEARRHYVVNANRQD